MNAASPQDQIQRSPLLDRIEECRVSQVAIIDDAYDLNWAEDMRTKVDDFMAQVQSDADAFNELTALCEDFQISVSDLKEANQKFWINLRHKQQSRQLQSLHHACEELFAELDQKLSPLKALQQVLQSELNLQTECQGMEVDIRQVSAQIFFLDYFLGEDSAASPSLTNGQHPAIERAKKKAREVYTNHPDAFVVLMSSKPSVEEQAVQFREETGLLAGSFAFINKKDFTDQNKLQLQMYIWATACEHSGKMRRFVSAIEDSMRSVGADFVNKVKRLTLSDYAMIQKMSLHKDGHPLGDYLLWLFSSYLGHLAFETKEVLDMERALIDQIVFKNYLPLQSAPTKELLEIYKTAVWNSRVDNALTHPRGDSSTSVDNTPYLHLGDLFIGEDKTVVWLLITPECDLAFTPDDDQRKPDLEKSLLFIQGRLTPIDGKPDSKVSSEGFELDGKLYRVVWEVKRFQTVRLQDFWQWKEVQKLTRKARLRLPYALEIQRAVTSDLSRVGMPVQPPLYQSVKAQFFRTEKGKPFEEMIQPVKDAALIAVDREGKRYCHLTREYVFQIQSLISQMASAITSVPIPESEAELKRFNRAISKYTSACSPEALMPLLNGFELPERGGTKFLEQIAVRVAHKVEGEFSAERPFLLNIIED